MRIFEKISPSWRLVSLGEITSTVLYGMNEKASSDRNGVPFVRITDINENGELNTNDPKYVPHSTPNISKYLLNKGDILIARSGSVGLSYLHNSEDIQTVYASYLIRFRLNQELVNPEYLRFYLYTPMYWNYIHRVSRGATILNINSKQLAKLPIPLPTIPEQKIIVRILQQAQKLKVAKELVVSKTNELPRSVFIKLFSIFSKENFDTSTKLDDIADVVSGVTKGRRFGGRQTVRVPYLRVANVQDGFLDLNTLKEIEVLPSDVEKYSLQKGDIVITEGGDFDKLGRGAIWTYDIPNCIHQNHVFRIRLNTKILSPVFFNYYLQSGFVRQYFLRSAKRTTNLASINISQLKSLPVPTPSRKLQNQFDKAIEELDKVKEGQTKNFENYKRLLNSLSLQAFTGKLTKLFREEEKSVISSQVKLRDENLKSKPVSSTNSEASHIVELLENINFFLSEPQQELLDSLEKKEEYLMPENDFNDSESPSNQVQRNLDLLAEIGLIKSVNLAIAPGETGNVFYTPAYRPLMKQDNTKEEDLERLEKETNL